MFRFRRRRGISKAAVLAAHGYSEADERPLPVAPMYRDGTYDLAGDFGRIVRWTEDGDLREGTEETPARAAKAWMELTCGYSVDIEALFKTFDADGYDEMIVVSGIPFASICEHHLLSVVGHAHVAYIPGQRVIGLSKIPRLIDAYARRLQLQERLTAQVADAMVKYLEPVGVMVVVEAEHACATLRGVRAPGTIMRTSAVRGVLRDKPEARAEALSLFGLTA